MAVGTGFATEVPTMEAASRHVFEVNEAIQGELRSLLTRLEPLFDAWQGQASTSFRGLKERWNADATALNEVLRTIGEGLVGNTTTYVQTEDANNTGFNAMTANLS